MTSGKNTRLGGIVGNWVGRFFIGWQNNKIYRHIEAGNGVCTWAFCWWRRDCIANGFLSASQFFFVDVFYCFAFIFSKFRLTKVDWRNHRLNSIVTLKLWNFEMGKILSGFLSCKVVFVFQYYFVRSKTTRKVSIQNK